MLKTNFVPKNPYDALVPKTQSNIAESNRAETFFI